MNICFFVINFWDIGQKVIFLGESNKNPSIQKILFEGSFQKLCVWIFETLTSRPLTTHGVMAGGGSFENLAKKWTLTSPIERRQTDKNIKEIYNG